MLRRTLGAALVALLSLPAVAWADTNPSYEGVPCAPQGCTDASAAVDCWVGQQPDWQPQGGDSYAWWRAAKVRQRSRDGRYEVLVALEPFRCPEVVPGLRVHETEVNEVAEWLAAEAALTEPDPLTSTLDGYDWGRLAQCESGGNWATDTGNGFYGGLQFALSSWRAVGGTGNPAQASIAEQVDRGRRLLDLQGPGAWPACSRRIGWR